MGNREVLKKMIADILHDVVWRQLEQDEAERRMDQAIDAFGSEVMSSNWYPYPVYPWLVEPHIDHIRDTQITRYVPYTTGDTFTSTGGTGKFSLS